LAEKYLSQAAQTFEQPKARKTYLYYIYFSLGKLYDVQNETKKAEAFYLKALAGFEKNKLRKAQTKEVLQALVKYYQKQVNTAAQNKYEVLLEKHN
jgi:tetratricopeptide (TPR) repeat protein